MPDAWGSVERPSACKQAGAREGLWGEERGRPNHPSPLSCCGALTLRGEREEAAYCGCIQHWPKFAFRKVIWISLLIWSNPQYTFAFTLLFKDQDFPFFRLTRMYSSRQCSSLTDKTHIRKNHCNSQHHAESLCWTEEAKMLIIMVAQ